MRSCIALWAATVLAFSVSVCAEEKSKREGINDPDTIENLINQLSDEDYRKRTDAQKQLEKGGPIALFFLVGMRKDTEDAEARTRIDKIIPIIAKSRTFDEWIELLPSKEQFIHSAAKLALCELGDAALEVLCTKFVIEQEVKKVYSSQVEVWQSMNEDLYRKMNEIKDQAAKREAEAVALRKELADAKAGAGKVPAQNETTEKLEKEIRELEEQLSAQKLLYEGKIRNLEKRYCDQIADLVFDRDKGRISTAVRGLEQFVEKSTWETRWRAAMALGNFGKEAASAADALKAVLAEQPRAGADADQTAFLKIVAAEALWKVSGEAAGPREALLELLKSNAHTRAFNAEVLGALAAGDAETVTALAALLKHDDQEVAYQAGWALRRAGPKAKAALPALKEALNEKREVVKLIAKQAIEAIENPLPEATPPPKAPTPGPKK